MKIQQIINNKEYLDRLAHIRSVGAAGNMESNPGGYDIERGSIAAFLDSIGLKQLPDDLAPIIEAFFASTYLKVGTLGLNSIPNTAHVGAAFSDLALLKPFDLTNLGFVSYTSISGAVNGKRRH